VNRPVLVAVGVSFAFFGLPCCSLPTPLVHKACRDVRPYICMGSGALVSELLIASCAPVCYQVTGGAPNKLSKIKVVRKSIARVLTVYRHSERAALRNKAATGLAAKGRVSSGHCVTYTCRALFLHHGLHVV
jgi:hypothetical protein